MVANRLLDLKLPSGERAQTCGGEKQTTDLQLSQNSCLGMKQASWRATVAIQVIKVWFLSSVDT